MSARAIPRTVVVMAISLFALIALFASDASATQVKHIPAAESCFATLGDTTQFSSTDASAVQQAVDAASPNETVKVAGVCQGVQMRMGVTQTVYISKSLTLRGGYTTTNWTTSDPTVNPTTLDAQNSGRVLYFKSESGLIDATVENLRITGGNASRLGGFGGGIYIGNRSVTLSNNRIISNTACKTAGCGANEAGFCPMHGCAGYGGGLAVAAESGASLYGNLFQGNIASTASPGYGGGLFVAYWGGLSLDGNIIQSNIASTTSSGYGGGLDAGPGSFASVDNNVVRSNIASSDGFGSGGGLFLENTNATVDNNTIEQNIASVTSDGEGGGVGISNCWAIWMPGLPWSYCWLTMNTIVSNTASLSVTAFGRGGGLYVNSANPFRMINNIVADNQANTQGAGLWLADTGRFLTTDGYLYHNTIADNHGSGDGVFLGISTTLTFIDTILSGHAGVGISVTSGSSVTLAATLWHANHVNTGGTGTIFTGTVNVYGDPKFMDPANDNYHLLSGSAAIDAGIDAGVRTDIDGDARPQGLGFDPGADEYVSRITDLHFSSVLTDNYTLTGTLRWTAPIDAVSYTLRYNAAPLDDTNWETAASAPGQFVVSDSRVAGWTTTVPYTGGIIYFALKFDRVGTTLPGISNNAFWPARDIVFLPLIRK